MSTVPAAPKALLWLGHRVQVWTIHKGDVSFVYVTWETCETPGPVENQIPFTKTPVLFSNGVPEYLLSQGQGTYIKVYMPASRPVHEEYLKRDLAKMYAPAIKQARKPTWTNTYHGSFKGMQQLADPFNQFKELVKVSGSLHHNGQTYDVEGEVGIVPNLPIRQCRVSFGFSSRVLFATTDCFACGRER